MPRGGELAHVEPEFGDDDLGGLAADAGDLVQTVQRPERGLGWLLVGVGAGGAIVAGARGPAPSVGTWAAGMAAISYDAIAALMADLDPDRRRG